MELHDALAALARDHGTALFADASAFRGALDDYLDEGTASTGTINLLTDAVRLGALDGMLTMLDSGADAESAVDTAGRRLSRDRGSADITGSQWACAVLGYALGKVPVEMATRLRPDARTADAGPASSTAPRPAQPAPPQAPPAPPPPQPGPSAPSPAPGGPSYGGWSGGAAGQPQPAWGAPPQPRKSRTGLIVGLAVVAVVLIIGTVIGIVALAGDDEDPSAGGTSSTASGDTGSTEPATDTTSLTTGSPDSLGGPTIAGDGYAFGAPEGWTDGTAEFVAQDTVGTIDSGAVWGDTLAQARASILVETTSAYGESDPQALKDTWISNVVNGITPVTADGVAPEPTDLEPTDVGGTQALGIELLWTNQNGIDVRQLAFLTINGDTLYSITASFKETDDGVEPVVYEILGTWAWQ